MTYYVAVQWEDGGANSFGPYEDMDAAQRQMRVWVERGAQAATVYLQKSKGGAWYPMDTIGNVVAL